MSTDDPFGDDVETISYSGYMPARDWEAWLTTYPTHAYERLHRLVRADAAVESPPPDAETETRVVEIETDTWTDWLETIPRTEAVHDRLTDLIERDVRAHRRSDDDMEDATARVIGQRLRIRATQARGHLRDDTDIDAAIKTLDDIVDLTDTLIE